jgi:hypothetical protein
MSFKDQILQDFKTFLASGEHFEDIVYSPADGYDKPIKAIVERQRFGPIEPDRHMSLNNQCEIFVANDPTSGISSIKKNSDKVIFPMDEGGEPVEWTIVEVLFNDASIWHLRVTR